MIYMTATWTCRPGAERTVEAALREFVTAVGENEPNTRIYTALQVNGDPNRFMTYFIFENQAARERHQQTDWVRRFTDAIYPHNLEPVIFTEYRLVASTDSALQDE